MFYVGQVGAILLQTLRGNNVGFPDDTDPVTISGTSTLYMMITKPDGTFVEVNGTLYSNGSDGKFLYVSTASLFDQAGLYQYQGRVRLLTTEVYYTDIAVFQVVESLS